MQPFVLSDGPLRVHYIQLTMTEYVMLV